MKITAIEINNFRGIEKAQITGVGDLVIVAGPNGSGKSCILDAIRLTKSDLRWLSSQRMEFVDE